MEIEARKFQLRNDSQLNAFTLEGIFRDYDAKLKSVAKSLKGVQKLPDNAMLSDVIAKINEIIERLG